jgi:hypothetical protein
MMITQVPIDLLGLVWPSVSILFEPAMKYANGRFDQDDVLDDLKKGITGLWIAVADDDEIVAAIVVRVIDYPKRRFARYDLVGSKPNTIVEKWGYLLFEAIENHARTVMGCSGIEGGGRHGWVKMSSLIGYKPAGAIVEKDL